MKPVLARRSVVSEPESELESPDRDLVKGCDGNSLLARSAAGMYSGRAWRAFGDGGVETAWGGSWKPLALFGDS